MKSFSYGSVLRVGAWGVVVGGAAGFALGVLLAPTKGARTRRRLSYKLERVGGQVSSLAARLSRPHTDSEARRSGDAIVADARARAEQIRADIDALLGEFSKPR